MVTFLPELTVSSLASLRSAFCARSRSVKSSSAESPLPEDLDVVETAVSSSFARVATAAGVFDVPDVDSALPAVHCFHFLVFTFLS